MEAKKITASILKREPRPYKPGYRLMTKFIPKGVSFVFFCTKANKNGIIEAEKG